MKKILLKNRTIYMINEKRLTTILDSEENMEIFDYDFDIEPSELYLIKDKVYFLNENSLYLFNKESEKSEKLITFEVGTKIFVSDSIYQVFYLNRLIKIKEYDLSLNELSTNEYYFDSNIEATIEESNLFMSDLWSDDEEITSLKEDIIAFTLSNDSFCLSFNNKLLFGKLDSKIYQTMSIPSLENMKVDLYLNSDIAIVNAKDGETSYTFSANLPLKRKRRGAIEKFSVNILKRGVDQITPIVSKNGRYWLGVDGENQFYPLLVNLKTLSPLAIFDEVIDNNYMITSNKDFSEIIISDFNNLKKYSWNANELIFDYEVEL